MFLILKRKEEEKAFFFFLNAAGGSSNASCLRAYLFLGPKEWFSNSYTLSFRIHGIYLDGMFIINLALYKAFVWVRKLTF